MFYIELTNILAPYQHIIHRQIFHAQTPACCSLFHLIWLRDNCRCDDCGDPSIGRRNLRLTELDLNPETSAVECNSSELLITWADGHHARYTATWLSEHAYDEESRQGSAVAVYYRGMKRLLELAEDEQQTLKMVLRPGDIAVFDNHRILHGRTDLTINGKRWLQWIQIERGDFHSWLRILADRLGKTRDTKPLLRGSYG